MTQHTLHIQRHDSPHTKHTKMWLNTHHIHEDMNQNTPHVGGHDSTHTAYTKIWLNTHYTYEDMTQHTQHKQKPDSKHTTYMKTWLNTHHTYEDMTRTTTHTQRHDSKLASLECMTWLIATYCNTLLHAATDCSRRPQRACPLLPTPSQLGSETWLTHHT